VPEPTARDVDALFDRLLIDDDPALTAARDATASAGMPAIEVSPQYGKFLYLLAVASHARRILEIGTLGGYSTIWLARALPANGKLITLESDEKHAEVARGNIARAGLAGQVELRVGLALDTLPKLESEQRGPFDLIFIDADKAGNAQYLTWALALSRAGTLIVADNVVRGGAIVDAGSGDPSVEGVRRFFDLLAAQARVSATAIQTVGEKGYDGFALAVVL
jgi:predicted O-methyltransferase YrrM